MNRRILLLVVLIALGALAWWLNRNRGTTTLEGPLSDFPVADTAAVDRIHIVDMHGRTIDLRRRSDGWRVNEHFATDRTKVDLLLRTFKRVEVRSPVPKSAEANVLKAMASGGTKVEIYQGGNRPVKTWIVGHGSRDNFGTYMLLEIEGKGRSPSPFVMNMAGFTGILNTRFTTVLDEWRASTVFHFNDLYDLKAVEVEMPQAPALSYHIDHLEDGRVRLTDFNGNDLRMDSILVRGALLPYQQLNYEYIIRGMARAKRDSLLRASPSHVVRVEHRSGHVQEARFWHLPYTGEEPTFDGPRPLHDPRHMYAVVEDTLLVMVQRASFDHILQPVNALQP